MSQPGTTAAMSNRRASLPRLLVQSDGLVVAAAGAVLLARARPLATVLGLPAAWPLGVLGAGCMPYGAWLCWSAARAPAGRLPRLVGTIAVANTAWALASAALLIIRLPALTTTGRWVLAVQAGAVAIFAAAEALTVGRAD